MDVQPANINQLRRAADGRFIEISDDVGGIVAALKRIDPNLGVRFAEAGDPPYWHVYQLGADGRSTELVMSVQAHETSSGVWTGLDQRVVDRVMRIGDSSYDFPAEVDRMNQAARAAKRARFSEQIGGVSEQAAHALRRDLGDKGRAVIPREVKDA